MSLSSPPSALPISTVVLDTNVVLDWLAFGEAGCRPLIDAIEAGHLQWVATESLRGELAHVLGRGVARAWIADEGQLWLRWQRWAQIVEPPPPAGPARSLRCTDPDDQKFIDLALAQADWLLSRDRAVLKLARRALKLGLKITTPERWAVEAQAQGATPGR